jgi:hypothetical protein
VKIAQQAGKAAPAVAVIGALAGAPQIYDELAGPTVHVAGHHHAAALPALPAVASITADRMGSANTDRLASPRSAEIAWAKARTYRARHTKPASHPDIKPQSTSHHRSGKHHHRHHTVLRCSGSGGMVPANYAEIFTFLVEHGYTGNAAAGIAGNIYQESKGDPESIGSGGGGLIGWTPLPGGLVTGNPGADLQTQLEAILTYNQGWAQYIPALNSAGSPAEAADIYVTDFERAGIPATSNREAAANAVADACGL